MKTNKTAFSLKEIYSKMEYYCAYQERCYKEVEEKLYSFSVSQSEKEEVLTYLIENNFINEERVDFRNEADFFNANAYAERLGYYV